MQVGWRTQPGPDLLHEDFTTVLFLKFSGPGNRCAFRTVLSVSEREITMPNAVLLSTEGPALLTPVGLTSGLRRVIAPGVAVIATWALCVLPQDLAAEARVALIVTVLSIIGWTFTRLPESLIALTAAVSLVLAGAVDEERLYATLGSDLVWLLLAAFIIAAVVKDAGLAERMVAPMTARRPRFAGFAFLLAAAIALTALILPSTSGRAALLLPVFLAVLPLLPDVRLAKALALLFPTVILLSAGGSLIGAGAHLIAVEAIASTGAPRLGYLDWLMLGGPLAVLATATGVALILWLFVPRGLLVARLTAAPAAGPRTVQQTRILMVVGALVALWLTEPWHGFGMSLVAMTGALLLLSRPFTSRKTKEVFRAVDVELILYMAATMLVAQAMTETGADRWLAAQAMAALPPSMLTSGPGIAVALSVIAVLSHLAIASRSARAAILVPAIALPMAGLGQDATLMILIAVMGTGFCQTLMSSAKPVAIYGTREDAGFTQADLFRLALPLGLGKIALLVGFATLAWPAQMGTSKSLPAGETAPVTGIATAPQAMALRLGSAASTGPAGPQVILATSPRPQPRPDTLSARRSAAKAEPKASPRPKKASLGAQVKADLKAAGRQLRRDLDSLF
jgi:solute carrier family 13 (sodium-dependent dicarboxylate transporter), member 2/3/5